MKQADQHQTFLEEEKMKRKKIQQDEINKLNQLILAGEVIITQTGGFTGCPKGYRTRDGKNEVKYTTGRFYGGGISQEFFTVLINNREQFVTVDPSVAEKAFYDQLNR